MKPNKARLRLWVAELRSGKWEQTTEQLGKNANERCCLGVACEVASANGGEGSWNPKEGELPEWVRVWFGLTENDPLLGNDEATWLNDHEGLDFSQIANRIETAFKLKRGSK